MPWCEDCAKFWNPSSMKPDGSCPTCGRVLPVREAPQPGPAARQGRETDATGDVAGGEAGEAGPELEKVDFKKLAGKDAKAPWHFKVLMALLAIYLTWRLVQLVQLVV
jgi:hypothetical protein